MVVRRYLRTFRWRYVLRPFVVGCVAGLVLSMPRQDSDVDDWIGALEVFKDLLGWSFLWLFVVVPVCGGIAGVVGRGVTGWLAVTLGLAIGTGTIIRNLELGSLEMLGMMGACVASGYWLVRLLMSVSAGSRAASRCPKCWIRVVPPARFCPFGHELPPPP